LVNFFAILLAVTVGIVLLGVAQRTGWIGKSGAGGVVDATNASQVFTCPMHPQIRQNGPGRCPICAMELVPATSAAGSGGDEFSVEVSPAARRLAGIQTAEARSEALVKSLRTVGRLAYDESRLATITVYAAGRVEEMFADYTGVRVDQGDALVLLYSPALYAAQTEYLAARQTSATTRSTRLSGMQETMVTSARQKLIELGMTDAQIERLNEGGEAESRVTIYSPLAGTVTHRAASEGDWLTAGEEVYKIADLSTVWLMLEMFPEDAALVRYGQQVEAEVQSLPGETFAGRVVFVDPNVDPQTRSVGVRVVLENSDGRLRPGDYATAQVELPLGGSGEVYDPELAGKWISPRHPQIVRDTAGECPLCGKDLVPASEYGYSNKPVDGREVVTVPRSAVLTTGEESVVYVESEPGRFELRPVTVGPRAGDRVAVLSGLKAGDSVATEGNFLLDSQMQLAGKPSLIDPTRAKDRPAKSGPLELETTPVEMIAGPAGETLEAFFAAYFTVQARLAADEVPTADQAGQLVAQAKSLVSSQALSDEQRALVEPTVEHGAHLAHGDLKMARKAFKAFSPGVIRLAARVRGEAAERSYLHYHCPMVPGGGGDWLQAEAPLANPYWGAAMLRCGDQVHELRVASGSENEPAADHKH
jgi:Cu(I)/Ag(I) efflux system membrane fusion protein